MVRNGVFVDMEVEIAGCDVIVRRNEFLRAKLKESGNESIKEAYRDGERFQYVRFVFHI